MTLLYLIALWIELNLALAVHLAALHWNEEEET